ncbi:hypothetical protein QP311_25825, partial [Escherichia coli]|nr:hypothetical protein [Escherichia coli]
KTDDVRNAYSGLADSDSPEDFIRQAPTISWVGHVMDNPAYQSVESDGYYEIKPVGKKDGWLQFDLDIHLDTFWDNDPDGGL